MKRFALPLLVAAATVTCGPAAREAPRTPDPDPAGDRVTRDVVARAGQGPIHEGMRHGAGSLARDTPGQCHAMMAGRQAAGAGQAHGMMGGGMGMGGDSARHGRMMGGGGMAGMGPRGVMGGSRGMARDSVSHHRMMGAEAMGGMCPMRRTAPPDTGVARG